MEAILEMKASSLHESLVTLIQRLYTQPCPFMIQHLLPICAGAAAFIVHPETRIAQKAVDTLESLVKSSIRLEPSLAVTTGDSLREMLVNGLQNEDSVIRIRYFELACRLALLSPEVCKVVEAPIMMVFDAFFTMDDPLSQMAIMDFVGTLS